MSDPEGDAPQARQPGVCEELSRSLNTIWVRHAGGRPSSVNAEISGDTVRFVMQDAVSAIGTEPVDGDSEPVEERSPNSNRYKNEAIAAVARITGRRVRGFIPKRNKTTDVASDTYVLEPARVRR